MCTPTLATTDEQIRECFTAMRQLRRHLTEPQFIDGGKRQMQSGYRLTYLRNDYQVASVAGFRIREDFAWGRLMYVDDLVTDETHRRRGYGSKHFAWLIEYARDSAVHNCT
jgi:GNAT superfamily N-acetyltransferase